jgi:hypothetical protein
MAVAFITQSFIMKNKEKGLAVIGATIFLAIATAIGALIRRP